METKEDYEAYIDEDYDPCLGCRVDRGDEDCCAGCEWEFLSWDSGDLPGHRD